MWNDIRCEQDITDLMELVYEFHDSCIKEAKYISGAYVNHDLGMHPVNDLRVLKMIIQRQFDNPSVIELEFSGLKYCRLAPDDEKFSCEIHDATMLWKGNCVYWCDCGGLTEAELERYAGTVVCAEKVRWRVADEYLGKKEVYRSIRSFFSRFLHG